MTKPNNLPPELQGAFSLFVEELQKHVSFLSEIIQQLQALATEDALEPISASRAEQLQNRFHKIKGGAGFLGLTEICELASKGELLFKDASNREVRPASLSKELCVILKSLEQAQISLT